MTTQIVSAKKLDPAEGKNIAETCEIMKKEIGKVFFGHEDVIESLIRAVLCDGHLLLEGIPGIAKTLAIKALAKVSGCSVNRIQFTVDLLPTDIIGLTTYDQKRGFEVIKGPVFANFVIADEINRSPPKTQSALIEAMQEKRVTIGKKTFELPLPFFVMATENPIENEGVYNLPEAQIDRFLFKVIFDYPPAEEEKRVMEENATFIRFEEKDVKSIVSAEKIIKMQAATHKIYLDSKIKDYIIQIVEKTRNKDFKYGEYIEMGSSPRASIALYIASKAEALLRGRNYVIPKDIDRVLKEILRYRIILSYRAQAEGITTDKLIEEILRNIQAP